MKYKSLTQKAITARFSISEYQKIEELAEENGSNLAEVIREAWRNYKKDHDLSRDLEKLKSSILKEVFDISSAVAGLSDKERAEALDELKNRVGVNDERN
jgi:ribosomal protein S13